MDLDHVGIGGRSVADENPLRKDRSGFMVDRILEAGFLNGRGTVSDSLSQSRAIALDMESATIAANGFRFRVPYGTLLCVSDKPLHGEIKLPGMANQFYRASVNQHLAIGMKAVEQLRQLGQGQLHSRKLRSFDEVAFQ